jgi:hypothetical protein
MILLLSIFKITKKTDLKKSKFFNSTDYDSIGLLLLNLQHEIMRAQ